MFSSSSNRSDAASNNLLGLIGQNDDATITQLTKLVVTHRPQAAITLDKQGVGISRCNRRDIAGYDLNGLFICLVVRSNPQLTRDVITHPP